MRADDRRAPLGIGHMLGVILKMASLIASTHWTLIGFPALFLELSDRPFTALHQRSQRHRCLAKFG
jgi:hypothetical protein